MSYAALYDYCQSIPSPADINAIATQAAKLAKIARKPAQYRSGTMKSGALRGIFVRPEADHYLAKHCKGVPLVVVARDLNRCWTRFVYIKEVMHLFDESLSTVGTPEEFEALVVGMTGPTPGPRLDSVDSEIAAYWMALGCMCPEEMRQDLQRRRQAGEMTDLQIAKALLIPEQTIPNLFRADYKALMSSLMGA